VENGIRRRVATIRAAGNPVGGCSVCIPKDEI